MNPIVGDGLLLHRLKVVPERPVQALEFFNGGPEEAVREALPHWHGSPDPTLHIGCSGTLLDAGGTLILIDPAGGGDLPARALETALARSGHAVSDIDLVLCTHVHEDRVAGLSRTSDNGAAPTFPNVRHLIHAAELAFVRGEWKRDPASRYGAIYARALAPVAEAGLFETIAGPDVVLRKGGVVVELAPAPGHTPGHFAVRVTAGGTVYLYTSDVFHHPIQTLDARIATRGDADPAVALATREASVAQCLEGGTVILGSHFPGAGAGRLRRRDGRVVFQAIEAAA
jgi:glyoxylase-like metal-dependent hydrolase (beta-lactamase superfamily II)